MARSYKILGQQNPAASTNTLLYSVPAATEAVVSTLSISNLTASAATYRIATIPSGETLSNKHYLAFNTTIPALDTVAVTLGLTLASSGSIVVFSSSASTAFSAFGSEIS
jgi:hypothetical protein